MTDPETLWAHFRTTERPVLALIQHAATQPDSRAELARLIAFLNADEAAAVLQEIEREKERRDAWRRVPNA